MPVSIRARAAAKSSRKNDQPLQSAAADAAVSKRPAVAEAPDSLTVGRDESVRIEKPERARVSNNGA